MIRRPVHVVRPPAAPTGWRRMALLSLVLHLVGFGGAIGLPRLIPRRSPAMPVYVVDLVQLPAPAPKRQRPGGGPQAKKTPPAPKPAPKKEEKAIKIPDRDTPKPTPEKRPEPKKEPPKPEPKKTEPPPEKTEKPAAPEPAKVDPEPAGEAAGGDANADPAAETGPSSTIGGLGTATIGIRGGTGDAGGDVRTFYYTLLKRRIESNWQRPIYPPNYTDRRTLLVAVRLSLSSSGRVTGLDLLTPSGYDALDRSIQRAVRDAEPFPPFPPQITRSSMTVNIEFLLHPD